MENYVFTWPQGTPAKSGAIRRIVIAYPGSMPDAIQYAQHYKLVTPGVNYKVQDCARDLTQPSIVCREVWPVTKDAPPMATEIELVNDEEDIVPDQNKTPGGAVSGIRPDKNEVETEDPEQDEKDPMGMETE